MSLQCYLLISSPKPRSSTWRTFPTTDWGDLEGRSPLTPQPAGWWQCQGGSSQYRSPEGPSPHRFPPRVLWSSQKTHIVRGLLAQSWLLLGWHLLWPPGCLEPFNIDKPCREIYWCVQRITEPVHGSVSGSYITLYKTGCSQSLSSLSKYICMNLYMEKV